MTQRTRPRAADGPDMMALPEWARGLPPDRRLALRPWVFGFIGVSGVGAAAALAALLHGQPGNALLFALSGAMAAVAAWRERAAARQALLARRRFETLFDKAGISLWLEDWAPVAAALQDLMQAGVRDMRAHFTSHPEQARRLRQAVTIKDVNAYSVDMMGVPDRGVFLGPLDRILPDTDQTFIEWLVAFGRGDRLYQSETHITRPDGQHLDVLFTASLPRKFEDFSDILVIAWDITAHKRNQEKLVQAETEIARAARITTIGALTASIAHELNSPLAAIVSNAEAALRWLRRPSPDLPEAHAAIAHVVADSVRAREVVSRTRSFLSNAPNRIVPADITETVRQAIVIIDRELRSHRVSLHFIADAELPPVAIDSVQIQQVLVNLMINGAQAMSEISGPRDLTVTIKSEPGYLRVGVRDIGRGIDAEDLARLFDPFFTTRPDGMGMGLPICKTCVEAHGGKLQIESEPGQGTLATFTLPTLE